MGKIVDLTGQRFGRLLVVEQAPFRVRPDGRKVIRWTCQCACGTKVVVMSGNLRAGSTVSCGCYTRQRVGDANRTHGKKGTPEYRVWTSMHTRCRDINNKTYGGRGITVCDRWSDFTAFLEDMGARPTSRHSIDRINVNKGYGPDNCRWATPEEQANNRQNTVMVDWEGEQVPLAIVAKRIGIKYATLWGRIRAGWARSDLFKPVPMRGY